MSALDSFKDLMGKVCERWLPWDWEAKWSWVSLYMAINQLIYGCWENLSVSLLIVASLLMAISLNCLSNKKLLHPAYEMTSSLTKISPEKIKAENQLSLMRQDFVSVSPDRETHSIIGLMLLVTRIEGDAAWPVFTILLVLSCFALSKETPCLSLWTRLSFTLLESLENHEASYNEERAKVFIVVRNKYKNKDTIELKRTHQYPTVYIERT